MNTAAPASPADLLFAAWDARELKDVHDIGRLVHELTTADPARTFVLSKLFASATHKWTFFGDTPREQAETLLASCVNPVTRDDLNAAKNALRAVVQSGDMVRIIRRALQDYDLVRTVEEPSVDQIVTTVFAFGDPSAFATAMQITSARLGDQHGQNLTRLQRYRYRSWAERGTNALGLDLEGEALAMICSFVDRFVDYVRFLNEQENGWASRDQVDPTSRTILRDRKLADIYRVTGLLEAIGVAR